MQFNLLSCFYLHLALQVHKQELLAILKEDFIISNLKGTFFLWASREPENDYTVLREFIYVK